MRTRNRRSRYLLLSSAAAVTAALVVGGCGGSDSDSTDSKKSNTAQQLGSNPADVVPADSSIYLEMTVKPQGEQKNDAQAAAQKLFGDVNIGEYLTSQMDDAKGKKISYTKDIDPWLGGKAALFTSGLENESNVEIGLVVSLTDAEKATAFNKDNLDKTFKNRTYKGTEYSFDQKANLVVAIYKDTTVLATEAGFKAIVDAGDKTLSEDKDYQETFNTLNDSPLGTLYTSKELGKELANSEFIKQQLSGANSLPDASFSDLANTLLSPTISSLSADADSLKVSSSGESSDSPSDEDALGKLPADSWAAFTTGFDGKSYYEKTLLPSFTAEQKQQLDQVATQLGIDLNEDLFAWMKGFEFYIAGTSIEALNGAMMINTSDSAKSKAFVEKLRTTFGPLAATGAFTIEEIKDGFSVTSKELPAAIQIGVRNDRMIIAYGKNGLDKATNPDKKLADDATFKLAQDEIQGVTPNQYVALAPITEAVNNLGSNFGADKKDLAQATEILKKFTYIIYGTESKDKKYRGVGALGLK